MWQCVVYRQWPSQHASESAGSMLVNLVLSLKLKLLVVMVCMET
jgi:hypothetical protein